MVLNTQQTSTPVLLLMSTPNGSKIHPDQHKDNGRPYEWSRLHLDRGERGTRTSECLTNEEGEVSEREGGVQSKLWDCSSTPMA